MPTVRITADLTVEQILEAVKRLSPQEFEREWEGFR